MAKNSVFRISEGHLLLKFYRGYHSARGVTHVLSILDPDWPELESFWAFDPHHRMTPRFHDALEPGEELTLPRRERQRTGLPGQAPGNDESGRSLTLIKAALTPAPDARTSIHSRGAGMSTVDMFYLGLVLTAFLVFAVALAYYSHR